MDGDALRRESAQEKDNLIKEIRETLEQTGHQAQMKKHMENAEAMQAMFKYIPVPFYIL
jgi:hypothetical protein